MSLALSPAPLHNTDWLRHVPIAHRGLHDSDRGIFENTLSACRAAMQAGYAMEVDLQPSGDGVPMVFHDYTLERMTGTKRNIREYSQSELSKLRIKDTEDAIPTLIELLNLIRGKVDIVLELKGLPGQDDGFVKAVSDALQNYDGNVCIMSFSHHLLRDAREFAPHLPLGLTAEGDRKAHDAHQQIAEACNVDFLSYEHTNLHCQFVSDFRQSTRPVICWTVRTPEEMQNCLKYSDQPTFEGFRP